MHQCILISLSEDNDCNPKDKSARAKETDSDKPNELAAAFEKTAVTKSLSAKAAAIIFNYIASSACSGVK